MGDNGQAVPRFDRRLLLWGGLVVAGTAAVAPGLARDHPALADPGGATLVAVAAPPVVTRAQWGADEALRGDPPTFAPVTKAVIHHTVTANADPDPRARVRAIYEFHTRRNGWSDIGYNFLVDGAGRVYEGRWARAYGPGEVHGGESATGLGVVGAHASGHNGGSIGIGVLGTFDGAARPSDAAVAAVAQVAAWKLGPRGIDPRARAGGVPVVSGHRDLVSTGCPGDGLYRRLHDVRNQAAAMIERSVSIAGEPSPEGVVDQLLEVVDDLPIVGGVP